MQKKEGWGVLVGDGGKMLGHRLLCETGVRLTCLPRSSSRSTYYAEETLSIATASQANLLTKVLTQLTFTTLLDLPAMRIKTCNCNRSYFSKLQLICLQILLLCNVLSLLLRNSRKSMQIYRQSSIAVTGNKVGSYVE